MIQSNCPQLPPSPKTAPAPTRRSLRFNPKEFKVVALRECAFAGQADTPDLAAAYWRANIPTDRYFNPDVECFIVLLVNTRRRILGHNLVSIGTLDTILVHRREVFSAPIVAAAAAIILVHNLCVAAHKLCYVTLPVMCSVRLAGLAILQDSGRREWHGFA